MVEYSLQYLSTSLSTYPVWISLLLVMFCCVLLGVGASFLLFACVGVECCVALCFRTCALAPAPACGLASHTDVGPRFSSTSPAKSFRSWPAQLKRAALWEPLVRQEGLIQFASRSGMLARLLKSCIIRA